MVINFEHVVNIMIPKPYYNKNILYVPSRPNEFQHEPRPIKDVCIEVKIPIADRAK
jgi:hypothetical protein